MLYMIVIDGYAILDKPMTIEQIKQTFGEIKTLEAQGYRLVKWQ